MAHAFGLSLVASFATLRLSLHDRLPMIDKLLTAEHLAQDTDAAHIIKKQKKDADNTQLWLLFSGPEEDTDLVDDIWQTLQTAYFETVNQEDAYDRFEEALKIVNAQIGSGEVVKKEDFLRTHSLLLGLFVDGTLHISVSGNAEVYLLRRGKLTPISEGLSPKKPGGDVFVNIASGELENDDKVAFASQRLLRHATANQLSTMLGSGILEAKESLQDLLHMAQEDATFILFHARSTAGTLPLGMPDKPARSDFSFADKGGAMLQNGGRFVSDFFGKLRAGDQKPFLAFVLGILGLIVIVIFLSSLSNTSDQQNYDQYRALMTQVDSALQTAEEQEIIGNIEVANASLRKADRDLQQILESGLFRAEALAKLEEASVIRDRINNITRISTPRALANLKSRKNDVSARGVFAYDNEWYAFDDSALFRIILEGVENVIPFSGNAALTHGVPFKRQQTFIFSDENARIYEYDPSDASNGFTLAKTEDNTWEKFTAIETYAQYLYLLDPASSQIWKYEDRGDTFGPANGYVQEDYDLSNAISLAIDGFIFVYTSDGQLFKMLKGIQEEYELVGAPDGALDGVTKMYTNEELEHILFLNPGKSSVYIFFKGTNQATYDSQIALENVGTLQDMWAEAPKTLIVVDETKVYAVDF